MWYMAGARLLHRKVLCEWLRHNGSPCDECNTHVVLMLRIRHSILGATYKRYVCNATRCFGEGKHLILRQRVRGSITAVRVIRNAWTFLMETGLVADATTQLIDTLMMLIFRRQ